MTTGWIRPLVSLGGVLRTAFEVAVAFLAAVFFMRRSSAETATVPSLFRNPNDPRRLLCLRGRQCWRREQFEIFDQVSVGVVLEPTGVCMIPIGAAVLFGSRKA